MSQWRNRKLAFVIALVMLAFPVWGALATLNEYSQLSSAAAQLLDITPVLCFFLVLLLPGIYLLWRVFFKKDWVS
jgi:hypothetical protein